MSGSIFSHLSWRYTDFGHNLPRAPNIKPSNKIKNRFYKVACYLHLECKHRKKYPPIIQNLTSMWSNFRKTSTPTKLVLADFTETW